MVTSISSLFHSNTKGIPEMTIDKKANTVTSQCRTCGRNIVVSPASAGPFEYCMDCEMKADAAAHAAWSELKASEIVRCEFSQYERATCLCERCVAERNIIGGYDDERFSEDEVCWTTTEGKRNIPW